MNVKFVAFLFMVISIILVQADFFYNHVPPTDYAALDLECAPGRTIVKVQTKAEVEVKKDSSGEDDFGARKSHMNSQTKDDSCQICVCSVEGKDEYCVNRPARNINECLRMATITEEFQKNSPHDLEKNLAYRIRRDYLWHNDEIPYEPKAKCKRGTSYYSNSINANDTDIDVASDVETLLDYSNRDVCHFCVCAVDGRDVSCISRDVWYCDYYRDMRAPVFPRDTYRELFKQDRPTYFRQLSYRVRRTMDTGVYTLMKTGGDALCCSHPSGHRRNLHNGIRSKIRQLRRRVPKEDLMAPGAPGVGGEETSGTCIPFLSEFSNCTEENSCEGCTKCVCTADGQWDCNIVTECMGLKALDMNENTVDNAWEQMDNMLNHKIKDPDQPKSPLVPRPRKSYDDELLDLPAIDEEEYLKSVIMGGDGIDRLKRSVKLEKNGTVKFHHTVDEINKDTLANSSSYGTVKANKFTPKSQPHISRRTGLFETINKSSPLHIEHKSSIYDHHITDNKIDTVSHAHDLYDADKLNKILGNQTQESKDKDLSKIIVNELKKGIEVVGDANAPAISNITFRPENDTLIAMAFIAGNLLNKLWSMEKDDSDNPTETDLLKHEKIADLLDLFKEPLTIRQESFLKNALEHLSDAIDNKKIVNNVTLCESVEKIKSLNNPKINETQEKANVTTKKCVEKPAENNSPKVTNDAIVKIDNVLSLIKKYEAVQNRLSDLKNLPNAELNAKQKLVTRIGDNIENIPLTKEEDASLNIFGNLLEKVTKLLVPPRTSKKIVKSVRNREIFMKEDDLKTKLKKIYDVDLENSTLSTKDRVILDLLSNMRNSNCQLNKKFEQPSLERGLLVNLSEFLKVTSFVDLLKLLEPEKSSVASASVFSTEYSTTVSSTEATAATTTKNETGTSPPVIVLKSGNDQIDRLTRTKENLKNHLKSIIIDLIELQNASGISVKDTKIKIADALPCLFNLLNADKNLTSNRAQGLSLENIKPIFELLKKELANPPTRRANYNTIMRPKSAVVWERIIKNLDSSNKNTRRQFTSKTPKSFEELKKLMENLDSVSNTYKKEALMKDIPYNKRLMLLKTLTTNIKQYIEVMEELKIFLGTTENLPYDSTLDANEFVDNAVTTVKLNEKLFKKIKARKPQKTALYAKDKVNSNADLTQKNIAELLAMTKPNEKLTREELLNQLIKNRIQYYLKVKERQGVDLNEDMNVRIAKRILSYANGNNNRLARELFKLFMSKKQPSTFEDILRSDTITVTTPRYIKPLLFENRRSSGQTKPLSHDFLLKQLINIKNM